MRQLHSYDDYMLEMLSEATKNDTLFLYISDRLKSLLKSIDHDIARDIIKSSDDGEPDYKVTFIDIDDSDMKKKDMISFLNSNKLLGDIYKESGLKMSDEITSDVISKAKTHIHTNRPDYFYKKNRSKTKIGRIVAKLFPDKYKQSGEPGKDIESFVNMFKASRDTSKISIVDGDIIKHWYNGSQYSEGGGSLNNSCMRYDKCEKYLDFYTENHEKIKLAILKDSADETKIKGRAIIWKLDYPSGRTYMDRIYTANDSDEFLFKEYAKEHGWLHKAYQNMEEDGPWIDTKTGKSVYLNLVVNDLNDTDKYPYMDTLKFFDGDVISSDKNEIYGELKKLDDTTGGYNGGGVYVEFYGDELDPESDEVTTCDRSDEYRYTDDCFYSEFYSETISDDYAESNMTEMDHYENANDKYRDDQDYITTYEGNDCDTSYAENNFSFSEYKGEWVEEATYCDYHEDYIPDDDCTTVYTDVEAYNTSERIDTQGDGDWWEWEHDNEQYDDNITEEELREHHELDVWSEKHGENIDKDDAVEVYTDPEQNNTDWRYEGEGNGEYWTWDHDGEKYDDDVTEEDLKIEHGLEDDEDEDDE